MCPGSDFGLDGDGVGHDGVEVVAVHLVQHGVHGVEQGLVALLDADADVDVLGALLLGGELEVAVGAGEVEDDEVIVLLGGGGGGGDVGADEVAPGRW